jgi:hypothetical protein
MNSSNTPNETFLVLSPKLTVPRSLFSSILRQVTAIAPAVDPHQEYTLQELCGEEYWQSLSNWHRRLAGKCMAHMVTHGLVPYCFAGHLCESPKKYMLK